METLKYYSGYSPADLEPTVQALLAMLKKPLKVHITQFLWNAVLIPSVPPGIIILLVPVIIADTALIDNHNTGRYLVPYRT